MGNTNSHAAGQMSSHGIEKAIYGVITVLAVLVVLDLHPPVAWRAAVTIFGTTLAVALVDTYAAVIAGLVSQRHALADGETRSIWRSMMPVMAGAQGPTIVLLLSAFGLYSVERALTIAEVVVVLSLFVFGLRIGKILHQHWWRQLLSGLSLVSIAGFVVAIKVLFH